MDTGGTFMPNKECFRLATARGFQRHLSNLIGCLRGCWSSFFNSVIRHWPTCGENVDGISYYYLGDFTSDKFHRKHVLLLFSSSEFSALAESCSMPSPLRS